MIEMKLVQFKKSDFERSWKKKQQRSDRPHSPSRVFTSFVGESVYEHLENRRQRPYTEMKPIIAKALTEAGIKFTKIRWNRYAGCDTCACSGGFIIEGHDGQDFWADIEFEKVGA